MFSSRSLGSVLCLLLLATFCQAQQPITVFLEFWEEMDENYAFFDLKKVDWDQAYSDYRPQISETMSDTALFEVLSAMLAPLEDDHIGLKSQKPKLSFSGGRPVPFEQAFSNDSLLTEYFKVVEATLHQEGFSPLELAAPILSEKTPLYNHAAFEYSESNSLAYVKISWFFYDWSRVRKGKGVGKDKKAYVEAFESLFEQFKDKQGLILDLRNNIGGIDGYPEELVAFFTEEKYVGEYSATRKKDHHEAFTEPKPTWVKPQSGYVFKKPVVILVNGKTVSAGEEFVQMMRPLQHVTLVGTSTQGALSDIYTTELPNDWTLTLSNMRFFDTDMKCWEGIGIPVDIEVSNTLEDVQNREDTVLLRGLEQLKEGW